MKMNFAGNIDCPVPELSELRFGHNLHKLFTVCISTTVHDFVSIILSHCHFRQIDGL